MTQPDQDTYAINPVPGPKPVSFQRVAAVGLIVGGTSAIVVGLFMPWFSIGIADLGGSAGAMLNYSEGPEDSAWSSIGDVATLILIGAICAVVGAAFVVAGSLGSGHPRRDRIADSLVSGASLVVGFGLLLAWLEWEQFSTTLLFFPEEAMPGVFDGMYGNGPWVTIGGAVGLVAGLTLHLTRQRAPQSAAASAVMAITDMMT